MINSSQINNDNIIRCFIARAANTLINYKRIRIHMIHIRSNLRPVGQPDHGWRCAYGANNKREACVRNLARGFHIVISALSPLYVHFDRP